MSRQGRCWGIFSTRVWVWAALQTALVGLSATAEGTAGTQMPPHGTAQTAATGHWDGQEGQRCHGPLGWAAGRSSWLCFAGTWAGVLSCCSSTGTHLPARHVQALFWGTLRGCFTPQWGEQRLWHRLLALGKGCGALLALPKCRGAGCWSSAHCPVPAQPYILPQLLALRTGAVALHQEWDCPSQQQLLLPLSLCSSKSRLAPGTVSDLPPTVITDRTHSRGTETPLQVPRGAAGWRGYLDSRGWPSCGRMWQKGWQRSYSKINCLLLWSAGVSTS